MTLGDVIKNFRIENNMTMEEFAKRAELSKGYISMLEKNTNPKTKKEITPGYTTIMRIADVMSMEVDILFSLLDDTQRIKWNSPQITTEDKEFFETYNKLNTKGKQKVREYTVDLSANNEYTLPDHSHAFSDERPLREAEYRIAAHGGTINQEQISPTSEEIS